MVCHVAHRCHNNRGADLVEGTVMGSSMHLMRVHNRCSMVHNGGRMHHGGSMMDHRGNMVDHWSSVDESGHNRLLFLFRCPQSTTSAESATSASTSSAASSITSSIASST